MDLVGETSVLALKGKLQNTLFNQLGACFWRWCLKQQNALPKNFESASELKPHWSWWKNLSGQGSSGTSACLLQFSRGPPRPVCSIVRGLCCFTHDSIFSCAPKPPFLPSHVPFNSRDRRTPFLLKQDKIYHLFKDVTAFMQEFFERTTLHLLPTRTLPVLLFQHDFLTFLYRLIDSYYPKYLVLWRPLAVTMKWQLKIMLPCPKYWMVRSSLST